MASNMTHLAEQCDHICRLVREHRIECPRSVVPHIGAELENAWRPYEYHSQTLRRMHPPLVKIANKLPL